MLPPSAPAMTFFFILQKMIAKKLLVSCIFDLKLNKNNATAVIFLLTYFIFSGILKII